MSAEIITSGTVPQRSDTKRLLLVKDVKGGGGGSVQDMQVSWTPSNVKLGQLTYFVSDPSFSGAPSWPGITSVTFNGTSILAMDIEGAPNLVSISAPNVTAFTAANNLNAPTIQSNPVLTSISMPLLVTAVAMSLQNNTNLTTIDFSSLVPTNGGPYLISGAALLATSVNAFLRRFVLNVGYVGGNIDLSGGTSAGPSGQGIADKATLQGRGVTVTTN